MRAATAAGAGELGSRSIAVEKQTVHGFHEGHQGLSVADATSQEHVHSLDSGLAETAGQRRQIA